MLSLCLEAALVGTSLAVSFSMRFLFPSTFPGFRNCFPRVGLILCVLGSFGLLFELAGGELQGCLCFVHPRCCPRLSFYMGDYFRVPGHELNVMGADKEATYRTKYVFLKVGSRGVLYICVCGVCVCLKKAHIFWAAELKFPVNISALFTLPFNFVFMVRALRLHALRPALPESG